MPVTVNPSPTTSLTTTLLASNSPLVTVTVYDTLSPKLGESLSIVLSGVISGTVTFLITVLSPTVTVLFKTP